MRITESQLRRIIRRAIKESSAQRDMNEGFFDSVKDFFSGKKGDEKDAVNAAKKFKSSYAWKKVQQSDPSGFFNQIVDLWEANAVFRGANLGKPLEGQKAVFETVGLSTICDGDKDLLKQILDNNKTGSAGDGIWMHSKDIEMMSAKSGRGREYLIPSNVAQRIGGDLESGTKNPKMLGISESRLRRVVRRIVKESFNRKVEDAIAKYSSPEGYRTWERMARGDFEMMAMGQDPDGIRTQYYPDWEDADFQAVLDAVG